MANGWRFKPRPYYGGHYARMADLDLQGSQQRAQSAQQKWSQVGNVLPQTIGAVQDYRQREQQREYYDTVRDRQQFALDQEEMSAATEAEVDRLVAQYTDEGGVTYFNQAMAALDIDPITGAEYASDEARQSYWKGLGTTQEATQRGLTDRQTTTRAALATELNNANTLDGYYQDKYRAPIDAVLKLPEEQRWAAYMSLRNNEGGMFDDMSRIDAATGRSLASSIPNFENASDYDNAAVERLAEFGLTVTEGIQRANFAVEAANQLIARGDAPWDSLSPVQKQDAMRNIMIAAQPMLASAESQDDLDRVKAQLLELYSDANVLGIIEGAKLLTYPEIDPYTDVKYTDDGPGRAAALAAFRTRQAYAYKVMDPQTRLSPREFWAESVGMKNVPKPGSREDYLLAVLMDEGGFGQGDHVSKFLKRYGEWAEVAPGDDEDTWNITGTAAVRERVHKNMTLLDELEEVIRVKTAAGVEARGKTLEQEIEEKVKGMIDFDEPLLIGGGKYLPVNLDQIDELRSQLFEFQRDQHNVPPVGTEMELFREYLVKHSDLPELEVIDASTGEWASLAETGDTEQILEAFDQLSGEYSHQRVYPAVGASYLVPIPGEVDEAAKDRYYKRFLRWIQTQSDEDIGKIVGDTSHYDFNEFGRMYDIEKALGKGYGWRPFFLEEEWWSPSR
jgi:hypothetical protein